MLESSLSNSWLPALRRSGRWSKRDLAIIAEQEVVASTNPAVLCGKEAYLAARPPEGTNVRDDVLHDVGSEAVRPRPAGNKTQAMARRKTESRLRLNSALLLLFVSIFAEAPGAWAEPSGLYGHLVGAAATFYPQGKRECLSYALHD